MNLHKTLAATFFALCLSLTAGCVSGKNYVPIDKSTLRGFGKLYFVPLEDFPLSTIQDLVDHYKDKYGISIEVLPSVPLSPSVLDTKRQQLIAEELITLMKREFRSLANDPEAILIGLTNEDMYIANYDWRFAFSHRQEQKYAVVSSARMTSESFFSGGTAKSRLRKMVTKNIGILYYHLAQSGDPRSVLYRDIGGTLELDNMGEDF
ncbi:MAG: hypothetical protein WAU45_19170 [Blastocatellia bacterium]